MSDINKAIDVLDDYVNASNDEWGEMVELLNNLYMYRYLLDEELVKQLEKQIIGEYENALENAKIIKTVIDNPKVVYEVEWSN